MDKPVLALDLNAIGENPFLVIGYASDQLTGRLLADFTAEVVSALLLLPDSGKTYEDILAIVNHHVWLVDTSGTYAEYTIDGMTIMAVIKRLNEQLKALPRYITCLVEDLYPELSSECGLVNYIALVEQEIERIEQEIGDGQPYGVLLAILEEALTSLREISMSKQAQEMLNDNGVLIPLYAPAKRHRSSKPIYIQFVTKDGHIASDDFRDSLPNAVRALEAIAGKWTNMTPGNVQEQYTGARVYNNSTGALLCYGKVEGVGIDWYDTRGELITDLSVLGIEETDEQDQT